MASKDALKAKLARVEALRTLADEDELAEGLRKALADRSNIVVAKAASIAASRYVTRVIADLIAAYDRLFVDAVRVDALARGKEAIANALKELDHREPAVFLRGLEYVQFEPIWGGSADVAGGLRAVCAHALVACDIEAADLLERLVDRLVDDDKTVRVEVVRAIAQAGGSESVLLLRLKALAGDAQAEVLGACFDALLAREGRRAVAFVERFLVAPNPAVVAEALASLAASREPEALVTVRRSWAGPIAPEARRAIVFGLAASRLPEAGEFLLSLVSEPSLEFALAAISALAASRFRDDLRERASTAARRTANPQIIAACARELGPPSP